MFIASAGVAISSAVNPLTTNSWTNTTSPTATNSLPATGSGLASSLAVNCPTNSWINKTASNTAYPNTTSGSTDNSSQLDITIWTELGCKPTIFSASL